ncbi:LCP family protein [Streptomyces sp. NPDC048718]|uniref:LCP family protein n=1 Tax=Streptomyces sp. NPDC048718 TaxID=3365587 RepID=UPI00371B86D6
MTDSADTPTGTGGGRKPRHWLRWTALGTALVVLVAAGVGWWVYRKLNANITADAAAEAELRAYEKERPAAEVRGARNILLIGSDSRAGAGNSEYGRVKGQRSDTTILLHIAAHGSSATAVSVPRDLMVRVPSCARPDRTRTAARYAQFNWAFAVGGPACTIRTLEKLTGIRIDHFVVVDFQGFKEMVDAVDGVTVCLKEPIDDRDARLKLPAGRQLLRGEQALGFVRARKTLGDGSDTERMDRQQQFLGALVDKVQSDGVLLNPAKLYPVLDAATRSLTTDPGLASLRDLYGLSRSMRSVPTDRVQFLTVPREPYVNDPNRDQLVQPAADRLFARLRSDLPVTVHPSPTGDAPGNGSGGSSGGGSGGEPGDDAGNGPGDDSRGKTATGNVTGNRAGNEAGLGASAAPGPLAAPSPTPSFAGRNAAQSC